MFSRITRDFLVRNAVNRAGTALPPKSIRASSAFFLIDQSGSMDDPFGGADLLVEMVKRSAEGCQMVYRGTVIGHSLQTQEDLSGNQLLLSQAQDFGKLLAQE